MKAYRKLAIGTTGLLLAGWMAGPLVGDPIQGYAPASTPTNTADADAAVRAIEQASDAPAAITAYSQALKAAPGDTRVYDAFVRRMIDLEMPDQAAGAAAKLLDADPDAALARAVVAYNEAKRGDMTGALTDTILAARRLPDDKFIQHTTGQLLAWYDQVPSKPPLAETVKGLLDKSRADLTGKAEFDSSYKDAVAGYQERAAMLEKTRPQDMKADATTQPNPADLQNGQANAAYPSTQDSGPLRVTETPPGDTSGIYSPPPTVVYQQPAVVYEPAPVYQPYYYDYYSCPPYWYTPSFLILSFSFHDHDHHDHDHDHGHDRDHDHHWDSHDGDRVWRDTRNQMDVQRRFDGRSLIAAGAPSGRSLSPANSHDTTLGRVPGPMRVQNEPVGSASTVNRSLPNLGAPIRSKGNDQTVSPGRSPQAEPATVQQAPRQDATRDSRGGGDRGGGRPGRRSSADQPATPLSPGASTPRPTAAVPSPSAPQASAGITTGTPRFDGRPPVVTNPRIITNPRFDGSRSDSARIVTAPSRSPAVTPQVRSSSPQVITGDRSTISSSPPPSASRQSGSSSGTRGNASRGGGRAMR